MGDSDLIHEFLIESYENLDRMDRDLVTLEKDPTNQEVLASVFRTIHTIKGTCGFLGFHKLESVTHVGENLLSKLREGTLKLNADRTSGMLKMVDAVREILANVEATEQEGDGDYTQLIALLNLLKENTADSAPSTPIAPEKSKPASIAKASQAADADATAPQVETSQEASAPVSAIATAMGAAQLEQDEHDNPAKAASGGVSDTTIRVDVQILDRLMTLVGELVLARNQVMQQTGVNEDSGFTATRQRLNLVTSELQESVMKTRMQPISKIWSKMPRVLRDISSSCGKKIRLELEGQETELDKTILEAIKDPLTHVVRNSVDHGVESPADRIAAGKPEEGLLRMRAFHEGGQVNIEISDDGRGINTTRVKAKAVEKGLISQAQADKLSECEAINLVFLPGFSTAEKITNVSGRGVGMDVVKTNIEAIGGTVDMTSIAGKGTTLRLKIPLTLAIIPALLVSCGGERFAIPQVNLLELVRVENKPGVTGIERIHDAPVYRLRGNLLPLVYLNKQLNLPEIPDSENEATNIVVLHADGRQFGLVVDAICDTEEIVVKPLSRTLKNISSFAGVTILGDGRVALILDVMGLAQKAHLVGTQKERSSADANAEAKAIDAAKRAGIQTLLLLSGGGNRRLAIQLSKVARLEEIQSGKVENTSQGRVVQYRGKIMPVAYLSELVPGVETPTTENLQVVVYHRASGAVGIVVERILDICEESLGNIEPSGQPGIVGSVIIQSRVTDVLDLDALLGTSTTQSDEYSASASAETLLPELAPEPLLSADDGTTPTDSFNTNDSTQEVTA